MISEAVSPLRRRVIEDMTIRQFGDKTKSDYIGEVAAGREPVGSSPGKRLATHAFYYDCAQLDPDLFENAKSLVERILRH